MPHHEDRVGIAAVLFSVVVSPADCLGNVAGHFLDRDVRHKAVVGRDEDETLFDERFGLLLHCGLVACSPAATVNPKDNRVILALGGSVDIEGLPFILRLDVG